MMCDIDTCDTYVSWFLHAAYKVFLYGYPENKYIMKYHYKHESIELCFICNMYI